MNERNHTMKHIHCLLVCSAFLAGGALAEDRPPEAAVKEQESWFWNFGADLRVRQEIMDHIPGHPGDPGGAYPTPAGRNLNWIRIRPRAWTRFGTESANIYFRVADEMREYVVKNGKRRDDRSYTPPDELIVDNLYLDLKGLFDDALDLRSGRQDLFDNGRPAFGAGRLLMDGTPYDGSRSINFDAIRATWHITEKTTLDLLAIYNADENELHLGRPTPHPRAANAIDPRDSAEMDEFGGGFYLKSREIADELPFELYYIYKRETSSHLKGARQPGRYVNTLGGRLIPKLTDTLTAEFEAAAQVGEKDSGASTSGAMGFAGLTYRPDSETFGSVKPFLKASVYYLSGDRRRNDPENRDTSWNPVWGRWPQDSEMLVYGPLYGLGYWSNLLYPSAGGGLDLGRHHKLNLYAGPMFAAVDDKLGGGDGNYQGTLGVIRYDFPIWKNPKEGGWGEIFGHVMAEAFCPGEYYESDQTAYFFRWEIYATF